MDKEFRIRRAKILTEFLRSEELRTVLDDYINEAKDNLAAIPPSAITQLQDAAYQLRARQEFLLTLKGVLSDASIHDAKEKAARNEGEPI
jgi:hypothetical protein